ADQLADQYRWTQCNLPAGDPRDYQRADGTRLSPEKKKPRASPRIGYEVSADGTLVGTLVADKRERDAGAFDIEAARRAVGDTGGAWERDGKRIARGHARAAKGLYGHCVASDDAWDPEPRGKPTVEETERETVADLPRRVPPVRKQIKWRSYAPMKVDGRWR